MAGDGAHLQSALCGQPLQHTQLCCKRTAAGHWVSMVQTAGGETTCEDGAADATARPESSIGSIDHSIDLECGDVTARRHPVTMD